MFDQTTRDQQPTEVVQPEVYEEGSLRANAVPHKRINRAGILAAGLFVVITVLLTGIIAASGKEALPMPVEPPAVLLPGNSLPDNAHCDYHPFMESRIYCSTVKDGLTLYLSYDMARHEIMDTVLLTNHMTVGELILTWGRPTGYTKSGASVQVYWGNRAAYVFSGPFTPSSRASFVTYSLDSHPVSDWHGFINNDN